MRRQDPNNYSDTETRTLSKLACELKKQCLVYTCIVGKKGGIEERLKLVLCTAGPHVGNICHLLQQRGKVYPRHSKLVVLPVWLRKQVPTNSHLLERNRGKNTLKLKV